MERISLGPHAFSLFYRPNEMLPGKERKSLKFAKPKNPKAITRTPVTALLEKIFNFGKKSLIFSNIFVSIDSLCIALSVRKLIFRSYFATRTSKVQKGGFQNELTETQTREQVKQGETSGASQNPKISKVHTQILAPRAKFCKTRNP